MRRARDRSLGTLAIYAVVAVGCGPIEYLNQVSSRAAGAVSAAKLAQADRYAPYELSAAEEYLNKAREEAGHAEYQDAIEYGRKAEELATRARARAASRTSPRENAAGPAGKGRGSEQKRLPGNDAEEGRADGDERVAPEMPEAAPTRPRSGGKPKPAESK